MSQAVVLRGTDQQSASGLLYQPPGIVMVNNSKGTISTSTERQGLEIMEFYLHNRSGSTISVGIGGRLDNRLWTAGQWTEATTTFTDDTTDAQDAGANDFALETTTDNGGFIIASPVPFGWVSINVGTAGVDGAGTTDRAVSFSNGAGTWTTMTANMPMVDNFTSANTVWAAGENVFAWYPPPTWKPTVGGEATNLPAGLYALRVRTTDAPDTTAALATTIEVGLMPWMMEGLTDNSYFTGQPSTGYLQYCDAIVALFSTANAGNYVEFRARGR
jgi:hypothetical protein